MEQVIVTCLCNEKVLTCGIVHIADRISPGLVVGDEPEPRVAIGGHTLPDLKLGERKIASGEV